MTTATTPTLESITNFILDKVAIHTETPREELQADTRLVGVGVDSLVAVLLCGYLEDEYQLEIEPMMMFEYKTADTIAPVILEMLAAK